MSDIVEPGVGPEPRDEPGWRGAGRREVGAVERDAGDVARPHSPLDVSVEQHPDCVVVRLAGELDVSTAGKLREQFRSLMVEGSVDVLVHVRDLTFLDSTGIGTLIGALKLARVYRGSFALVEAGPRVLRVLELTGLDHVFRLLPSLEAAGIGGGTRPSPSRPKVEQAP